MEDKESMIRSLTNSALIEIREKSYENALEYFQKALAIAKELDHKQYIALQLGNIGSIYRDLNKSEQALEYYEKALPLYQELEHQEGIADQYTNIAYIHVMEGRLEPALELYRKALPIYQKIECVDKSNYTKQNIENLEANLKG